MKVNQNHLIDEALQELRAVPAEWPVSIPWAPGRVWNNLGRTGATVALATNSLGVTKNEKGQFQFYWGRNNAGKWFFRVWNLYAMAAVAAPLLYLLVVGFVAGKSNGIANLLGMLAGGVLAVIFGGQMRGTFMARAVYDAIGHSRQGVVWGGSMAVLLGVGAVFGGALRMVFNELDYSFNFSWPGLIDQGFSIEEVGLARYLTDRIVGVYYLAFYGAVIVYAPKFLEAMGIGIFNQFAINEACEGAGVPASVWYASGRDNFTANGVWGGMLLNGILLLMACFFWLFWAQY